MDFDQRGIRRYFKNTSWLMGGQVLRMALSLVVTVAMARYLGPEGFGQLSFVFAITLLIGVLANLGLENRAKKELVESPDNRDRILGTYFLLTVIPALVLYGVMMGGVLLFEVESRLWVLYLWLGGVFLLAPFRSIELWFQAQVQSKYGVLAMTIGLVLGSTMKLLLILFEAGLDWFAMAIFAEALIANLARMAIYHRRVGSLMAWKMDGRLAGTLLKDSWPLLLSGLAISVYMQMDQVMLGVMLSQEVVGQYAAVVRVSTIWYFIPMILGASLFPAIVQARETNPLKYRIRMRQFFELNAFLAYTITIPMSLAAPVVIPLLYGEAFSQSAPILSLHIWSTVFVFLGVARGQVFLTEGLYRFTMIATLAGAGVNLILNFVLIPVYGGLGAAFATLVAQMTASVGICFFSSSARPIGFALVRAALFPFQFLEELSIPRR
jgi:O-antigen/teichoic acid export membrane protein